MASSEKEISKRENDQDGWLKEKDLRLLTIADSSVTESVIEANLLPIRRSGSRASPVITGAATCVGGARL